MNLLKLTDELLRDEGLRLKPYTCTAGKLTIGVGRNLTDRGITKTEAMLMLAHDIDDCCDDLDRALPWWRTLDPVRQRVLANMCFNLGLAKLLTFKNTLAAVEAGDYLRAADGMRASLWARQVGQRAERLAQMMATGQD